MFLHISFSVQTQTSLAWGRLTPQLSKGLATHQHAWNEYTICTLPFIKNSSTFSISSHLVGRSAAHQQILSKHVTMQIQKRLQRHMPKSHRTHQTPNPNLDSLSSLFFYTMWSAESYNEFVEMFCDTRVPLWLWTCILSGGKRYEQSDRQRPTITITLFQPCGV